MTRLCYWRPAGLLVPLCLALAPCLGWAAEEPIRPTCQSEDSTDECAAPETETAWIEGQEPIDQDRLGLDSPDSDAEKLTSPSIKEFPKELAKNFRGLFTRRNLMPLIVGASATAGAAALDSTLRKSPENDHHFAAFGGLGGKLGHPAYLAAIFSTTFVAGRMSQDNRFRAMSYDLMQGYVITTALTSGLKHAIGRARPNHEDSLSFPSGHASTAFTYATILSHYYGLDAAIPAYALAGFIGFSRVEKNAHNLSDVVAGMTLGYIVGRTVVHKPGADEQEEPRFSWMPQVVPGGGGVNFTVGF